MPATNEQITKQFTIRDPYTKNAANADSLPTAVFTRNGVDTTVICTVENVSIGVYKVSATIPDDYIIGDEIAFRITATINLITDNDIINLGEVGSRVAVIAPESIQDIQDVIAPRPAPIYVIEAQPSSNGPRYKVNDVVYLRESAAIGFLEAVIISGVTWGSNQWLYSVRAGISQRNATHYGDKVSFVNGAQLLFTEEEFIPLCTALDLIEANLQRQLADIQRRKASLCEVTS